MNRKIFWLLLVAAVFAAASCAQGTILFQDDFNRADGPPGAPWLDFTIGYYGGNPTSIVDGRLTATPVFNTCVDPATLILTDFCVTVDAKSYRAANLFLRIQNIPDVNRQRFLVCSLQPYWNDWAAPVIYFHEYYYGWGGAVGFVFIDPDIGPDIQMGATVIGSNLTFSITDGVKTYVTSHVIERAGLLNPGAVGVNCLGQGYNGPQSFDNFTVYDATGTGNATGTVTEAVSGAPVEGAVVDVVGTGISTTTGVDGTYSLTGLPLGGQKIRVRMFGYKSPPDILVHILPDQTATANAELTAINLDWARAASATASVDPTIAGNVNDADASTGWLAPSPGSWVQLDWDEALSISTVVVDNSGPTQDYTVQSSLDGSSWSEVKQVISAETGHSHWLEVIELPSPVTLKHLRVLVNSASYATGTIWSVECYKPKGNVIGVVKDSSGAPVSGADVYVYEAEDGK
ncbi:MAG: carboxypeptidase regulatory-like domain-containing protein, partial [Armatimonadetes bacterium]|nr:carboxypeptidase regulatory-like domain-containing protein [Armatimonadota bacterium]